MSLQSQSGLNPNKILQTDFQVKRKSKRVSNHACKY